jgi:2-methylisocitrate lyase-like PEP mutase family enzyme
MERTEHRLFPLRYAGHDQLMSATSIRDRFRSLHAEGTFVIPNPYDRGSCRLLTALGFDALATTSGGLAASMGRQDMTVNRDELIDHVRALCSVTHLPISVDAERCFPDSPGGVAETLELLGEAGAAGCSLEDWNPDTGTIEEVGVAVDRVGAASVVADRLGLTLTARAENHLRGRDDVDDTIGRLAAYRDAGAHVVYAPGLADVDAIARVVAECGAPTNVLLLPGGPSVAVLSEIGVRRVSIGSSLTRIAYGALVDAAKRLQDGGSLPEDACYLSRELVGTAFAARS